MYVDYFYEIKRLLGFMFSLLHLSFNKFQHVAKSVWFWLVVTSSQLFTSKMSFII